MKLFKLLGAKAALQKLSNTNELPIDFIWDMSEFIVQFNSELERFEDVKRKVVEAHTVDNNIDDSEALVVELNSLLEKDIDISVEFIRKEDLKKLAEAGKFSASDLLTIKTLLELEAVVQE